MVAVSDIRDGIVTNLETIANLNVYPYIEATVNPPAAYVFFEGIEYSETLQNGEHKALFTIRLWVQMGTFEQAQADLDEYVSTSGAKSILLALESDTTLGGVVSYCVVTSATPLVGRDSNGIEYLGADFDVEVCF